MFGEGNTTNPIGPSRLGVWIGTVVGCLLLATAVALVSDTADGLNVFGRRLPDTTPSFTDSPSDSGTDATRNPQRPGALTPPPAHAPVPAGSRGTPGRAATETFAKPACTHPGYAAVLEPASEPIGTALARSLAASDLQPRFIELRDEGFGRRDVDRIMAGDGSSVPGLIKEGTLVVAQLKVQVRQTVIGEAPMTEVAGTMSLAIVRNSCGAITVQRHSDMYARSVNETLDDGIRGLGEIFKEKIADLVRSGSGPTSGAGND